DGLGSGIQTEPAGSLGRCCPVSPENPNKSRNCRMIDMMTTVSLVRHGLVHNPTQIYYGRLPGFSLAETGRAQAAAAGHYLAGRSVEAIYCSPMQRAVETAQIIRAQFPTPAPLAECALLNEIHSAYDGQTVEEMERRDWDFYALATPPHEQPADVLNRILQFF